MTTVSARPDNLATYHSKLEVLDRGLQSTAGSLLQTLQTYRTRCPEFGADHTELAHELGRHAAAMKQLDWWVGQVGEAFRQADRAPGPVPVGVVLTTDELVKVPKLHGDPSLYDILNNYQVADDEMVDWEPPWPASLCTDPMRLTRTEAELLNLLSLAKMKDFKGIKEHAEAEAKKRYPGKNPEKPTAQEQNYGHMDAFRHAYWNALMANKFGQDFARKFGTAHEGIPGNEADREAMDLYNNEVGRRIAKEHPDASPEELANLVQQAVERGEMVVIDRNGELAWSNQVPVGQHGRADDPPRGGRPAEKGDSGDVESRGAGS